MQFRLHPVTEKYGVERTAPLDIFIDSIGHIKNNSVIVYLTSCEWSDTRQVPRVVSVLANHILDSCWNEFELARATRARF